MNHKQLLALFLCFVMILSSKIVSIESNNIVSVKDVSNNIDKYKIESICEDTKDKSINIFYPVTKYEKVNNKIKEKIDYYKEKLESSEYISQKKKLTISFEEFEHNDITSFKFNIKSNVGIGHDLDEVFTIVFKEDEVIEMKDIIEKYPELIEKLFNVCSEKIKENSKVKQYSNDSWISKGLVKGVPTFSNYIINDKDIIIFFNPESIAPYVAGIIQVRIPMENLELDIE